MYIYIYIYIYMYIYIYIYIHQRLLPINFVAVPSCSRPWHDVWVIAHTHTVTCTNQEKGGLGRQ